MMMQDMMPHNVNNKRLLALICYIDKNYTSFIKASFSWAD